MVWGSGPLSLFVDGGWEGWWGLCGVMRWDWGEDMRGVADGLGGVSVGVFGDMGGRVYGLGRVSGFMASFFLVVGYMSYTPLPQPSPSLSCNPHQRPD